MNKMQMRTALAEALEVIRLAQNFCGDVGADPKDNATYKACNLWLDEHREEIRSLPSNEDMCESLDCLERITAMWEKLKESLLERAKGCGISSPVDLKRIQHFVTVTLAEMTDLETAGPARKDGR